MLGKATCMEKYIKMPMDQNMSKTRPALAEMVFASSLFRLPMPTIRDNATEGKMVICQILMKISLMGAKMLHKSPKIKPIMMPKTKPSNIHRVKLSCGSLS